jgi:hypothetical protein
VKTLKQLWIENSEKPFWASNCRSNMPTYCAAISPDGYVFAWDHLGKAIALTYKPLKEKVWTLCDDPTKKPKMRVWRCTDSYNHFVEDGLYLFDFIPKFSSEKWQDVTNEIRALLKEDV